MRITIIDWSDKSIREINNVKRIKYKKETLCYVECDEENRFVQESEIPLDRILKVEL